MREKKRLAERGNSGPIITLGHQSVKKKAQEHRSGTELAVDQALKTKDGAERKGDAVDLILQEEGKE